MAVYLLSINLRHIAPKYHARIVNEAPNICGHHRGDIILEFQEGVMPTFLFLPGALCHRQPVDCINVIQGA